MTAQSATLESAPIPSWVVVLGRASALAIAAIVITFSADHSPAFGLAVFGSMAIVSGALQVAGARLAFARGAERGIQLLIGALSLVAGIGALAISAGLPYLVFVVSSWAITTGVLELGLGIARRGQPISREWIFAGALTLALGLLAIFLPPDIRDAYNAGDGEKRFLTSPVVLVGIIGAYCAVLAVYLGIAGFSLKWATNEPNTAVAESDQ